MATVEATAPQLPTGTKEIRLIIYVLFLLHSRHRRGCSSIMQAHWSLSPCLSRADYTLCLSRAESETTFLSNVSRADLPRGCVKLWADANASLVFNDIDLGAGCGGWQERPLPPSRCRLYKYSYVRLVLFTAFLHAEREAG